MKHMDELREYIDALTIIDTHEHLPNEDEWAAQTCDVLGEYLSHYFSCDLVSAGLSEKTVRQTIVKTAAPLTERWRLVEPFWNAARNTGYARALDIAARDLYGLPGITRDTIEELNAEFLKRRHAAASGKSYYRTILKEKSRIAVSLLNKVIGNLECCDRDYFCEVYALNDLIDLRDPVQFEKLSDKTGIRIHSLEDYAAAIDASIEKALARGAVALKAAFAYNRPIRFEKVVAAEAEEELGSILASPSFSDDIGSRMSVPPALEDYMMHHVLQFADRRGLVVQVHTGLQEGNGNVLANSNPELLTNLFLEYGNVTFDIFHISYPFEHALAAIAKNFRNVTIDFCWAHIISPEASVRALAEYLDSVPANKICAFGGDYLFPDGVYAHQKMARRNVAKTLSAKVEGGVFDMDRARQIAKWLFYDNPKRIFNLTV
jgi:predicted TIM-barrel fold metal-dependent hydrolase